jgi:hypothetical protein
LTLEVQPSHFEVLTPAPTNLRWLYLLALFQLVAGPLVLVTALTFCEITVREVPTQGLTEALSSAWHSPEVQALIQNATGVPVDDSNAPLPIDSGRQEGKKVTWCVWQKQTPCGSGVSSCVAGCKRVSAAATTTCHT